MRRRHSAMTMVRVLRRLLALSVLVISPSGLSAQTDSTGRVAPHSREYTAENPLVYEDVWDLWPYSYLNDNGEPEGYNIDLIRLMMSELNIPYIIRLKPSEQAFNDLKNGRSDLMLGLAVGFHDEYGLYSKNAVTLFTQSVVTPKNKPVIIKTFRDLGKPGVKVIVNSSSLCYHLMQDYNWTENAIPEKDIREAIQRVSAREEGQIVWNTLTLKWLMNRYLIDNLELTPVNMPHGEYKFMSNDQHLLDLLDEELSDLNTTDKIKPLQDKWFYPERHPEGTPEWVVYTTIAAALLMLILLVYAVSYRLQSFRLTRTNNKRNRRLALILQTSQVRMWTYNILTNEFAWRNENGQIAYTYSMDEFSHRYSPEDFRKLKDTLDELANCEKSPGKGEKEVTLELRARDTEGGDQKLRDYVIVLSVLHRDRHGKATMIIGTKKDVTEEREQQRRDEEQTLRYWAIFHSSVVGIILFNKDGILENINPKACEMFCCQESDIINEKVLLQDILDIGNLSLEETDGYYATQLLDLDKIPLEKRRVKSIRRQGKLCNEFRLMTVYDDNHELLGIFAIVRDITSSVQSLEQLSAEQARLNAVRSVLQEYNANIDSVLLESDVRLATYSPSTHMLTIHRSVLEVQHTLTQTRCMTLVADYSKKHAMHALNDMDERADRDFHVNIRTILRIKGNKLLKVQFHLTPLHDKEGNVVEYLGLLRDVSELREIERQLAEQTAIVQEVESTKTGFVKNMVQEIRTPMNTIINYVEQFNPERPTANEGMLSRGILDNADRLLHLIDNILYLSRLQARMVEIDKQPRDFAEVFETQCITGWAKYKNANTRYIVENPYEQLVVDTDVVNLGIAIGQVTANAAQFTQSGVVRARYDYIGRRLIISVDDTGQGMPPEVLAEVSKLDTNATQDTKGLGIAITKELVSQMGGTVEVSSELGSGTTVYIMIPCHASIIKRKKLV